MIAPITVLDNFCPEVDQLRQSAIESGFGTWRPNKGEVGSSIYEGMNFWGRHSIPLKSLVCALGKCVFPNNMFFRITMPGTEKAYIHSDRAWGTHTCILYLSQHEEMSGTAFYRHKKTGLVEMPTFEEMKKVGLFDQMKKEMVDGSDEDWQQTDFITGSFNRALIFHAPLFHSRIPKHGLGTDDATGRLVWVCHFTLS